MFIRELRIEKPWTYKAPFLISIPYALLTIGAAPLSVIFAALFGSLVTILGIAAFGYALNDWADMSQDAAAGRANVATSMGKAPLVFLFASAILLAIVPWFTVLPLDRLTAFLLASEFLFFGVYSLPPFRLKEHGAGILCDALYAYATPALLAALTFAKVTGVELRSIEPLLAALLVFQLAVGVRSILLHQIRDATPDRAAGVRTWTVRHGESLARSTLRFVLPLEVVALVAYALVLSRVVPILIPGLVVSIGLNYWAARSGHAPFFDATRWPSLLLDAFYCEWAPLLVLLNLAWLRPELAFLFPVHLIVFPRNAVVRWVGEALAIARDRRHFRAI